MRLLIATSSTLPSEAALVLGGHIVQRLDPSPTVLTVIRQEADRPAAEMFLARAVETLAPWTQTVRTLVRVGQPAEEIVREAEEGGYELVIVGERENHGLVSRFLLGSTATRVVEHAPCPVIVAKGKVGPIHRLLLCESGIEDNSLVKRFVAQVPGLVTEEEEVTVLHVMSQISAGPGVTSRQLRASAWELIQEHSLEGRVLESSVQVLTERCANSQPKVRHGLVVDEILKEARSGDYDLVIIGAHPGEGWRRALLADLANKIITGIDRPVLVVRPYNSQNTSKVAAH
jgi:nucleotide-binding universal stress UspA family protein